MKKVDEERLEIIKQILDEAKKIKAAGYGGTGFFTYIETPEYSYEVHSKTDNAYMR